MWTFLQDCLKKRYTFHCIDGIYFPADILNDMLMWIALGDNRIQKLWS
jgi:hypothetical protein